MRDRFTQIGPTVLLAVDGYRYGGRAFGIRETVAAPQQPSPGSGAYRLGGPKAPSKGHDTVTDAA